MGKFDGYLICSDLDGTFRNKIDIEPNLRAVKYFTDNGGKFTFATGRTVSHLEKLNYNHIINAPACICNGAVVYDGTTQKVLREARLEFKVMDFIDVIKRYNGSIQGVSIYNSCFEDEYNCREINSISNDIMCLNPLKIVCVFLTPEETEEFKNFARNEYLFETSYIGRSWSTGVEFNSINATKGCALDFIKSQLDNIHTTIGIGDYENDIPLLSHADIGVAVNNALEIVKSSADIMVKPCEESAVADLISILDSKI
ncbi:MAG: HAD-IIB family hydrolase [Clostridia bacterium]|nr:HAD-IIB family hydrolase [Clostridia bacterium]